MEPKKHIQKTAKKSFVHLLMGQRKQEECDKEENDITVEAKCEHFTSTMSMMSK